MTTNATAGSAPRWRAPELVLGLLTALAILAVWEGLSMNMRPETSGMGGDFHQFYTAGKIVAEGNATRLYDQPYFRSLQAEFREDPLCSLYPPTMGLLMSPLGRLTLGQAIAAWWCVQAVCLLLTGVILYRTSSIPAPWRGLMLVALAGSLPIWIAVGIGHLSPVLLVFLSGGLALHRKGRLVLAGFVLSVFALKPQLAAGLCMWMMARRDARTLLGLAIGFAAQGLVVAAALGPGRWIDFFHAMPTIAGVTRAYRYSPLFEQSLPGIVCNWMYGRNLGHATQIAAMRAAYIFIASAAAVLLCRFLMTSHPLGLARPVDRGQADCEYACGVLFMMLVPPYFLVYDLTLLIVPIAYLWSSPAWRWGLVLYATTTVLVANMAFQLGFSLTAPVMLATMTALAWRFQPGGGFRCHGAARSTAGAVGM